MGTEARVSTEKLFFSGWSKSRERLHEGALYYDCELRAVITPGMQQKSFTARSRRRSC